MLIPASRSYWAIWVKGCHFILWRISMGLARDGRGGKSFRDTFCEHFYITTSGFFPTRLCCAA